MRRSPSASAAESRSESSATAALREQEACVHQQAMVEERARAYQQSQADEAERELGAVPPRNDGQYGWLQPMISAATRLLPPDFLPAAYATPPFPHAARGSVAAPPTLPPMLPGGVALLPPPTLPPKLPGGVALPPTTMPILHGPPMSIGNIQLNGGLLASPVPPAERHSGGGPRRARRGRKPGGGKHEIKEAPAARGGVSRTSGNGAMSSSVGAASSSAGPGDAGVGAKAPGAHEPDADVVHGASVGAAAHGAAANGVGGGGGADAADGAALVPQDAHEGDSAAPVIEQEP